MATYFDVKAYMPDGNVTEFPDPFSVARLNEYLAALNANFVLDADASTAGECKVTYSTPGDTTITWEPTGV